MQNTKHKLKYQHMNKFGETIRELRTAQDLGLRETATKVGISPAYLSRIERGKETPPRPEIIQSLAKILAADPDVLFRLSSSTNPDLIEYINLNPELLKLFRYFKEKSFSAEEISNVFFAARKIK
ncbi:MAG TPA: helix-turn-helix transcriptional regulator [bacterium]|nr:helix-turn-helix transcriptional regulator [bacterium]